RVGSEVSPARAGALGDRDDCPSAARMSKEGNNRLILQRSATLDSVLLLYVGGLAMVFMSTGFSVISFFAPVPLALSTMVLPLLVVILTRCPTGASVDSQVSPSSLRSWRGG